MSLLQGNQLTITELAKRVSDKGVATMAEVLNETNDFLGVAPFIKANQKTGHVGTVRQSLPSGAWRKLNSGVDQERSDSKEVTESIGMLEGYSDIDVKLARLSGNVNAFRAQEDMAFVEGMGQTFASTFIYGNTDTDPEQFDGLAPRLNDLSYGNVIGSGGTGNDLSSLYIVQWGINKAHFIYPEGSVAGMYYKNKGQMYTKDANNKDYEIFRNHFHLDVGLFVHDDRCIIRIANIETSGSTNIFDPELLIQALRLLPNKGIGAEIYGNRTILGQMDLDIINKANVQYSPGNPYGRPPESWRGFPVKQVDAILNTESAVS